MAGGAHLNKELLHGGDGRKEGGEGGGTRGRGVCVGCHERDEGVRGDLVWVLKEVGVGMLLVYGCCVERLLSPAAHGRGAGKA